MQICKVTILIAKSCIVLTFFIHGFNYSWTQELVFPTGKYLFKVSIEIFNILFLYVDEDIVSFSSLH